MDGGCGLPTLFVNCPALLSLHKITLKLAPQIKDAS
jgi:hypothetical protein